MSCKQHASAQRLGQYQLVFRCHAALVQQAAIRRHGNPVDREAKTELHTLHAVATGQLTIYPRKFVQCTCQQLLQLAPLDALRGEGQGHGSES